MQESLCGFINVFQQVIIVRLCVCFLFGAMELVHSELGHIEGDLCSCDESKTLSSSPGCAVIGKCSVSGEVGLTPSEVSFEFL